MNFKMIRYILGWVLIFESAFMLLPCVTALIYGERSGFAFLFVLLPGFIIGWLCTRSKPKNLIFYAKEGFVTVSLSWILLSFVGALPFVISREIPNITDALFETISGFTTTGASILSDVESLSHCMLFWRSFTHWIGGMGVLVFILAILPMAGGYSLHLMRAESPGPSVGKLVPKMRTSAVILYSIYLGMTVVEILLLFVSGMALFDSITLSFGTAGTGGFGILNSSVADYTFYQQSIITIFMILFGVNFNVYFLLLFRKAKQAFRCEEMWWYFGIIGFAIIAISINIGESFEGFFESIHHASFQVASIITTTGYSTVDFNLWPSFSKIILVCLMFIGACAGSTGGGIKVSRILIYLKSIGKELAHMVHPRSVKVLRLERKAIDQETIHSVNVFLVTYILIFTLSVLILSLDELDLSTNFTAIAATLNNIGPGLELVGPTGNFSVFSPLSKFVLMFDMLAGRLELIPMLLLFVPATWKIK